MSSASTRRLPRAAAPALALAAVLTSGVFVGRVVEPSARSEDREVASATGLSASDGLRRGGGSSVAAVTGQDRERRLSVEPVPGDRYRCRTPEVPIERTTGCELGLPYPSCRWVLPPPYRAGRTYRIWRNTVEEHLEGRPALVSLVLAVADQYARQYPGEVVYVGDLDAPGPRHETHDSGVDVDLYLPGAMEVENLGNDEYAENYRRLGRLDRRVLQERVQTLARVLATCTGGRLRIYYNDDEVRRRFLEWYAEQGFTSPFGQPMQKHNDLHRFHFHVTIPKEMEPLAPTGATM